MQVEASTSCPPSGPAEADSSKRRRYSSTGSTGISLPSVARSVAERPLPTHQIVFASRSVLQLCTPPHSQPRALRHPP
jgi:hypothetical protein